ncbi:protein ElaB [Candidatus Pantoea edessiphila]|uniref:Protein ElaB n=1 Tax=Candidatus Pantoea edessiphila TaxID=2044610 RepID=A0A2P5T320_9GAMM|nr:protein ElaB [Candidatus Pantoea edessiphila]
MSSNDSVIDDLALMTDTLEEVLKSSGDLSDQKYIELKKKAEKILSDVTSRINETSSDYYSRMKKTAFHMDDYLHEKPWYGVGIGAIVGLLTGFLLMNK